MYDVDKDKNVAIKLMLEEINNIDAFARVAKRLKDLGYDDVKANELIEYAFDKVVEAYSK